MKHLRFIIEKMINTEATDHVFLTYGCDFSFTQADMNYFLFDKVMENWNTANPDVKMFYSTPSRYIDELKKINANG
jgi:hypothetical protein